MKNHQYQVGGCLKFNAKTYVERQADIDLYNALIKGEFCYVLNSRQMGKSSLRVRTTYKLQQKGIACASIDMTRIGSDDITPEQWYKGIAVDLLRGFGIFSQIKLKEWWKTKKDLSPVQRLSQVIEELIFNNIESDKIAIFIDEIDSVISLPFSSNDFFALIRSCYDRRAEKAEYNRLTFALFGVGTPGNLISDRTRTPFNIGKAIYLNGFKLEEAQPLAKGLEGILNDPELSLKAILSWTGGQPFLTQKICLLIVQNHQEKSQNETICINDLVKNQIIKNWQESDEPEHFKTIINRIFANENTAGKLLVQYQHILEKGHIKVKITRKEDELLLSGLVTKEQGKLKVYNKIYQQIFNKAWVKEQLANLRPYAQSLNEWIAAKKQDNSRLLRGNALKMAKKWAFQKSLSDIDYQFLSASETLEQKQIQQELEVQRLKEIEARRILEQKSFRRQRILLAGVSLALTLACGLGIKLLEQNRQARLREIRAIAQYSRSLFATDRQLEAIIEAIRAKKKLQELGVDRVDSNTKKLAELALGATVYGVFEYNRFSGHKDGIWEVDFSPDNTMIATASWDKTVKLWKLDGTLLKTIRGHQERVFSVRFTPDSKKIASASTDGTVKLWTTEGELIQTYNIKSPVYCLNFSPDGKYLAAATGGDNTIQLWDIEGKLLKVFKGHTGAVYKLYYSYDGKSIASASKDKTIKIWDIEKGKLIRTLRGHTATIWEVEYSKNDNNLVSSSEDKTIKLWTKDGKLLKTIRAHSSGVLNVEYSFDGKRIVSVGDDNDIKIWLLDGTLMFVLKGHQDGILDIDYSFDGKSIATSSWDKTVKLWRRNDFLTISITAHNAGVSGVGFSGDERLIVTASRDNTAKVWTKDGILKNTFTGHNDGIYDLSVSPDSERIATVGRDRIVRIWKLDGTSVGNLSGHQDWITSVDWSPNGKYIVSGSWDKTVKLWTKDGKLLRTFTGHKNGILDVDFGANSDLIASASDDNTIKLWKFDGTIVKTIKAHNLTVRAVALDPQGELIVTGSRDRTIKIWNMKGKLFKTLNDHKERIWDIIFSPDGKIFASASDDKTIKLWNRDGKLLKTIYLSYLTRSMAFSSDGKMLITGGRDNTTRIWNIENILKINQFEYACNWVRDYLRTNAEVKDRDRHLCE